MNDFVLEELNKFTNQSSNNGKNFYVAFSSFLSNTSNEIITKVGKEWCKKVSQKWGIDEKELFTLLDLENCDKNGNDGVKNGGCAYEYVKGKRSGNICGEKCKDGIFCSKHTKYAKSKAPKKENIPVSRKEHFEKNPRKVVIRKNRKLGKFWHPESRLIFKSKEEIKVIGKFFEDIVTGECSVQKLNGADIAICRKWSFAYEDEENEEKEDEKENKKCECGGNLVDGECDQICDRMEGDLNCECEHHKIMDNLSDEEDEEN